MSRFKPPPTPPEVWVVIAAAGEPAHASTNRQSCHDHIKDAIDMEIEGAEEWVVRKYVLDKAA